jgi:hypothetical protein
MKDHQEKYDFSAAISPIEEIVEEARNGRMYILVDAEDRENEGRPDHSGAVRYTGAGELHGKARARSDLSVGDA